MRSLSLSDAFPSSEAFEAINAALSSDEAGRKDAIKNGKAVFAFTLKNKAGETASWHIDLKDKGVVAAGLPENANGMIFFISNLGYSFFGPDCMLTLALFSSHPVSLRRGFWQARYRQGQRPASLHVRQAKGQGRRHEGHQDGAHPEEGSDQG